VTTSFFDFASSGLFSLSNQQDRGENTKIRRRRHSFAPELNVPEDRCVPSLIPSADGMTVLDTRTGMNWLANGNLAATMPFDVKGINPDGSMTWETAMSWVAALNKADYLGHNDWILPVTPPPRPSCDPP
jgi:hypothetical protein